MQTHTKRIIGALLLGPLTLVPTLALYFGTFPLAVTAMVLLWSLAVENVWLALIAMTGNGIVAFASYRLFRSPTLAALTLVSAIATQGIVFSVDNARNRAALARSKAERDAIDADLDHIVRGYATMGAIGYEVHDLNDQLDNRRPELGPIYRRLTLRVPVTVSESGVYNLRLRYETPDSIGFRSGLLQSVDTLGVGEHEISVQFKVGEYDYPGLWSPETMGGRAAAELYGKVDQRRLIGSYRAGRQLGTARLEQLRQMESGYTNAPWKDMWVDSVVTEFPGRLRYPKESRWGRTPELSRLTDKQEDELRLRKAGEHQGTTTNRR